MLSKFSLFFNQPKKRNLAIALALLGTVTPLVGLHKFYLGQPLWGIIYFLLSWQTPIPRIACAMDSVLYLAQDQDQFNSRFNNFDLPISPQVSAAQITGVATALRELEQLRVEGLITEIEFEQKRRQLLGD